MVVAELVFALVATLFVILNRGVDVAVDGILESRRLPSPPTGLVLDARTTHVVGAHDWGRVVFWSFVSEEEAASMFERVRLRRLLLVVERNDAGEVVGWRQARASGHNRHVDGQIRAALERAHNAARRHAVVARQD
jgi:hypothetical protein